jgi:hypothetical protein
LPSNAAAFVVLHKAGLPVILKLEPWPIRETDPQRQILWRRKADSNPWSLRAGAHSRRGGEEFGVPLASSPRLDLHDPRGKPIAELADRYQRSGVSLNSFAPGGVGTSKTLRVTETNE